MESNNLESRVWQRVSGGAPMDLEQLAHLSQGNAAALAALAAGTGGKTQRTLQQLHGLSLQTAQTLRGICRMRGVEQFPAPVATLEPGLGRNLARSYHRSRELYQGLESWGASGEYGAVFRLLARRETQIGAQLLELLGAQ